jgi:excisionase family DNA binding protein
MILSIREAAAHLGVGRNRVYELVARGQLPHLRIGKTIRIPTQPLAEWISARTEGSRP